MKKLIVITVVLGWSVIGLAQEDQGLFVSPSVSSEDLAARFDHYRLNAEGEKLDQHELVLYRNEDYISYQRETALDVWKKNSFDEVRYLQVYHEFKTYIEYSPIDLEMVGEEVPNWQQLGSLFDLESLPELGISGDYQISGITVNIYQGDLHDLKTTVHWMEEMLLPLKIEYHHGDTVQVMDLTELYPGSDAPWPRWSSSDYIGMDYVDIGDNDSHPLVQALNAGSAHGH